MIDTQRSGPLNEGPPTIEETNKDVDYGFFAAGLAALSAFASTSVAVMV
jgi:hypothetical protein